MLALLIAPAFAAPAPCDRNCLLDIATRYADGLTAQTFDEVAFAATLRSTENTVPTAVDAGVVRTAQAWRYRHTVVDDDAGQIVLFGTVSEGEKDAMIAIRLAVVDRQITESERLVVRETDSRFFVPRAVTAKRPVFEMPTPPEQRMSRDALTSIANRYFDAISAGDPSMAPFHPDCNRFENGMQTTNNPPRFASSCSEGIRRLVYMTNGRERRFPLVDPAHGLVIGIVAFDMPPMNETRTIRGKPVEFSSERLLLPRTLLLFELFKIDDGRIRAIEAVMMDRPFGAGLGWPGAASR
jgi:hypothetical protein